MRVISVPVSFKMRVAGEALGLGDAMDAHQTVLQNAHKIIASAGAIERQLEEIVMGRVFPSPSPDSAQFFAEHILHSDAVTLAAKRRLTLVIAKEIGFPSGGEFSALEKELKRVMSVRNAFAHGTLVVDSAGSHLQYFEGGRREDLLDEAYWDKIEATFASVHATLLILRHAQTRGVAGNGS